MTRKFIVHIGPPKTGTSSLQEALFQHRDQLLALGYDYPAFGRHPKMSHLPGHHGLAQNLHKDGLPPQLQDALRQLPDDRRVILSSESFAHVSEAGIEQLLQVLGADNVEIIYYARRWEQLLPSVWQELIKHGHSQPYLEFINQHTSAPAASLYLNYANTLNRWAAVAGAKNLRIFSYDNLRAEGHDIVQHFCTQVLGVELQLEHAHQHNPRQQVGRTETLRMLNWLAFGGKTGSARVRAALEQNSTQLQQELADLDAIYRPHIRKVRLCAPPAFRYVERHFLKRYGAQVENLAADGRLFHDRDIVKAPYVHPNYLLDEGVMPRLRQLLQQIGQG